jgi:hypothetical protein
MSAAADLRASLRAGGFRQCSFGSARLFGQIAVCDAVAAAVRRFDLERPSAVEMSALGRLQRGDLYAQLAGLAAIRVDCRRASSGN